MIGSTVQASRLHPETFAALRQSLARQLPAFLSAKRWFGGKARQIATVDVVDAIPVGGSGAVIFIATVRYQQGAEETYSIPLVPVIVPVRTSSTDAAPRVPLQDGAPLTLDDAFSRQAFLAELLDIIKREEEVSGERGRLRGSRTAAFTELSALSGTVLARLHAGEQSNSSVIYEERLILKFFRRMEEGENPDLEIGRFLTEKARFPHVARIAGSIDYQPQGGQPATQAILQEFVTNQGDAWRYTLKILNEFYQGVGDSAPPRATPASDHVPEFARKPISRLLDDVALLGQRTAELHLALSSNRQDAAFAPEPFTPEFQSSLESSFRELASRTLRDLRARLPDLPAKYHDQCAAVAAREPDILRAFHMAWSAPVNAMRARIHGDYHLGQVLYTGSDFVIIDFEGEPARPLEERRMKQSPLQDVAGMLRSIRYAAFAPLLGAPSGYSISEARTGSMSAWAEAWSGWASKRFLEQYYETSGSAIYLPANAQERARLLQAYILAKAVYELGYELNNRPEWVGIPLEGIVRLLPSGD